MLVRSGLAGGAIEVGWPTVRFFGLFFATLGYQRVFVQRRLLLDPPETCSSLRYGDPAVVAVVERAFFCAAVSEETQYVS